MRAGSLRGGQSAVSTSGETLLVPLPQFAQGRWSRLIAYPQGDPEAVAQRLAWLQREGVTAVYRQGSRSVDGFAILGLGYRGLVLLVQWRGQPVALKLRRLKADEVDLSQEAEALEAANQVGVGPQLLRANRECLLMDYCPGAGLLQWLQQDSPDLGHTWQVLQQLLDQAFRLDQLGLDHGDLRCVTEHVRVQGDRPVLIDFGGASRDRRPANVTTLTQGIWIGTAIAGYLQQHFAGTSFACATGPRRIQLIEHLRQYKLNPGPNTHQLLLKFLGP